MKKHCYLLLLHFYCQSVPKYECVHELSNFGVPNTPDLLFLCSHTRSVFRHFCQISSWRFFFLCLLPTTSFLFSIEGIFHEFLFRVVTFIASNCVDCARLYSICAFCIAFPVHHMLSFCLHKKVLVLWMWATPFFIYEPIFMDFFLRIFLRLSHCCEQTTHTIAQTYTHNFFPLLTCDYYYIRL